MFFEFQLTNLLATQTRIKSTKNSGDQPPMPTLQVQPLLTISTPIKELLHRKKWGRLGQQLSAELTPL